MQRNRYDNRYFKFLVTSLQTKNCSEFWLGTSAQIVTGETFDSFSNLFFNSSVGVPLQ